MSHELHSFRLRLANMALEQPHACALWGEELRLSYAELDAEIDLRQQLLRDVDAKVVALAMENGPDALVWDLAILFSGLPCLVLPPFFSAAQRRHCLEQSQADLVIAHPGHEEQFESAGFTYRSGFWLRTPDKPNLLPANTAKLTFTSGTTGTPKGV